MVLALLHLKPDADAATCRGGLENRANQIAPVDVLVLHPNPMLSRPNAVTCRAGLYKQLAELKNVVSDYRESPAQNAALKGPIIELLAAAGLEQDCPFRNAVGEACQLSPETAAEVEDDAFAEYACQLNTYLQVDNVADMQSLAAMLHKISGWVMNLAAALDVIVVQELFLATPTSPPPPPPLPPPPPPSAGLPVLQCCG